MNVKKKRDKEWPIYKKYQIQFEPYSRQPWWHFGNGFATQSQWHEF